MTSRLRALASAAGARLSRARTIWLAAAVVLVAAGGYLLTRRSRRATPAIPAVTAPVARPASAPAPIVEPTVDPPAAAEPVLSTEGAAEPAEKERPLATPLRVAIVVGALVAFFAISLLATKR